MKRRLAWDLAAAVLILAIPGGAYAQQATGEPSSGAQEDASEQNYRKQMRALDWVMGPQSVELFSNAKLAVPEQYVFLGTADTEKLQRLQQNLGNGNEYFFAPKDFHWQSIIRYSDDGYVKDDEKIDADAILKHIAQSTERANEERRQRGWDEMEVVGWQTPPYYDAQTHRLEWAVVGRDKKTGERGVNFNTRILGRGGVTSVVLVSAPERLEGSIAELKDDLKGFDYRAGQKYAEYRPGDKVAKYGLAALITGGAAAIAVKTGLWKVILGALAASWKFVAAACVALFGFMRRMFKRKST
jgi:uncharacterized membrane-anchored protein